MLLSKKKFKPKRKFRLSAPFAGALGSGAAQAVSGSLPSVGQESAPNIRTWRRAR